MTMVYDIVLAVTAAATSHNGVCVHSSKYQVLKLKSSIKPNMIVVDNPHNYTVMTLRLPV